MQGWAHPRSRGEHLRNFTAQPLDSGSSPLARGTRNRGCRQTLSWGLIPARAGNTFALRCPYPALRAHPRSRGEHFTCEEYEDLAMGSSPLARGTPQLERARRLQAGLIPARAGNTRPRRRPVVSPGAHPRSRGEHLANISNVLLSAGLIPARAGNTLIMSNPSDGNRAHPRSRGEHLQGRRGCQVKKGSYPLARGTRVSPVFADFSTGLIPARAGNTLHR